MKRLFLSLNYSCPNAQYIFRGATFNAFLEENICKDNKKHVEIIRAYIKDMFSRKIVNNFAAAVSQLGN